MRTDNNTQKDFSFIDTRVAFLQKLDQNINRKNFNILTIGVENYKNLRNVVDKYKAKNFVEELLLLIDNILTQKSLFAQYESHLYVAVFEDISFEELQKIADDFQTKMVDFIKQQNFNPFIELFTFNVKGLDFNSILTTLDKIATNTLTKEDISQYQVKHIQNKYVKYDNDEEIYFLLKSIFIKKAELKLINFYKGLKISTNAKILKIQNDHLRVQFESLQGLGITKENSTVLHSSSFLKNIEADIRYISLQKQIVVLENFRFSNGDVNAREHNRVECATKTPIVLSQQYRGSISGDIIDISIKALAIKARYTKMVDNIRSGEVKLSFVLPSKKNTDGFTKLELDATVTMVVCHDRENELCKIVCTISQDTKNRTVLTQYIHERQKEIIMELKKLIKINS